VVLLLPILTGGGVSAQTSDCGPFVTGGTNWLNGEFLLGISYYGAIGAETEDVVSDLEYFHSRGINNVRVWANWTHQGAQNSTVFDANGTLLTGPRNRLEALIAAARGLDMTVDLTFTWRHFVENQCTGSCDIGEPTGCWNNFKNGLTNVANRLRTHGFVSNVFFDLANEASPWRMERQRSAYRT
jgi:hypothetical protein